MADLQYSRRLTWNPVFRDPFHIRLSCKPFCRLSFVSCLRDQYCSPKHLVKSGLTPFARTTNVDIEILDLILGQSNTGGMEPIIASEVQPWSKVMKNVSLRFTPNHEHILIVLGLLLATNTICSITGGIWRILRGLARSRSDRSGTWIVRLLTHQLLIKNVI